MSFSHSTNCVEIDHTFILKINSIYRRFDLISNEEHFAVKKQVSLYKVPFLQILY